MTNDNKPTILVAEDEPIVLMSTVDFLENAGFRCLEAGDADRARALLQAHPEIVALFTDIEMRGPADGLDLAREAHARRPDIAVVVASGRVFPLPDALPPGSLFLTKPYRAQAVTAALQELLAA